MSSATQLKEEFLHTRIQQIEISDHGEVIASDDVLFSISATKNISEFHPFFETLVSLIPSISGTLTYPCVNIYAEGSSKILDITIVQRESSVYILLFDFTEHYQYAHPLVQEKNETAIAKNKLAFEKRLLQAKEQFKNNFLANLNHEIRNPLNNLLGFMELLKKTKLSYDQNETLKVMQRTGQQIKLLMDDMLDISKIERGAIRIQSVPFNLGHIVKNLQQHYKLKIGKNNVAFETVVEEDVPKKLIGDPVRLNQILFNLLENAYRNTESGTITLKIVLKEKIKESFVLHFFVSNTGKEIPTEEIDRIFDSYYQFKENTISPIGEGLGLKIVKELVVLQEGNVSVNSNANGTTFSCELPFKKRVKKTKRSTVPKGSGVLLSKRILVVEDEETSQMLFMRTFLNNDKGYILEIAKNSSQAFKLLEKKNYSLVIIKNAMPDSSSVDFIKELKSNKDLRGIPILVASGSTLLQEQEEILKAGANAFLPKPYTQKELFDSIEKLST
ncbi:ATP-binding response regulator [Marinirhabdus gelatinilytica]|uniref:histidine kinase n=1 Tax=Marinirhabdus gelatinilytica TaxID=1703343 RepID=A0A370QJ18_9FLAO|nr:hybrid sensor histidine kinase/response regulator [Marinirhabdus gelatinilytica]RDK88363.1 signal transduction histidine kinase [Marinirhabdus gelatinilytica]